MSLIMCGWWSRLANGSLVALSNEFHSAPNSAALKVLAALA
jgi:hypothetical protein